MLEVSGLGVRYQRESVLHDVDLLAQEARITALIGHNGAGKTTLLRAVLGLVRPFAGSVRIDGRPVTGMAAAEVARSGVAFVPQGQHVFRDLSVRENLEIGHANPAGGTGRVGFEDVFAMFPVLRERERQSAGSLSGGQQQMVALSMALLRNPRLMMLDEPSTGLAPVLVDQVLDAVVRFRDAFGVTLVVVDQNVGRLMEIADRVYVLKAGSIVFDGTAAELGDTSRLWSLF